MKSPLLLALVFLASLASLRAVEPTPIPLWPDKAPGETAALPPESDVTKPTDRETGGHRVIRISNVSTPTMTVYPADPAKANGAAVLVFPGGGYSALAYDLEGSEVCAWLNSIGVTGVLIKYRVPRRAGNAYTPPLQDAQRAIGLVRSHAAEWKIDPKRIGVLGFSAGGHLAANLGNNHATRSYSAIDAADVLSCRPDFCVLIYPAYLVEKNKDTLAPEFAGVSAANTPPTFLAVAEDDVNYCESSLFYYIALRRAKVPAELHAYPDGGHGFGLRPTASLSSTWPSRAAEWLRTGGWLTPAK